MLFLAPCFFWAGGRNEGFAHIRFLAIVSPFWVDVTNSLLQKAGWVPILCFCITLEARFTAESPGDYAGQLVARPRPLETGRCGP
jgi:hypothetical protein